MSALATGYDAVLLDLDGTVYRGGTSLGDAETVVAALRSDGVALAFVTNNASRRPDDVARHLSRLGVPAEGSDVVTSAQAAGRMLAARLDPGAKVLVVGTEALAGEVRGSGLHPVRRAEEKPVAVVQGHSPDTGWRELAEACRAIRDGAWWVACNVDPTLPTEHGQLPGNGAMVAALRVATASTPEVAGKPERPLVDEAARRLGARNALVVGDRLDTDVAAAAHAGLDALLVLTGVSDAAALLAAPPHTRPRYLGRDLRALHDEPGALAIEQRPGWRVETDGNRLVLRSKGAGADDLDALRTLCAAWWAGDGGEVEVGAGDEQSAAALRALGLGPA